MFDFIKALFGLKTMPSPKTVKTVQEVAEKIDICIEKLNNKKIAFIKKTKKELKEEIIKKLNND